MTRAPRPIGLLCLALLLLACPSSVYPQFAPLVIFPQPPPGPPVPLLDGVVGQSYGGSLSTNGGDPNTAWTIIAGAIPPGLARNPSGTTLLFSGAPTTAGNFTFTAQAVDVIAGTATQQYSIRVVQPLVITTPNTLPSATAVANYIITLTATGGTPPYTWSLGCSSCLSSGKVSSQHNATLPPPRSLLPSGMSLSPSGVLSGTPSQTGTFTFDVQVADSGSQFALKTFTLTVNSPPAITSATVLQSGTVGNAYSTTLTVSGGTAPYQWTVQAGALPPGINLSPGGTLSGVPTEPGTYNFSGTVMDVWGAASTANFTITITPGLAITTLSPLPSGSAGVPYSLQFGVSGGKAPYVWQVLSGALPTGLTFDSTGLLSGTPQFQGTANLVIQVFDSSNKFARGAFVLTVTSLAVATQSLPGGALGAPYLQSLSGTGGTPPYTWAISAGTLPPGLTLDPASGTLSGTPTTTGDFKFTIQLSDSLKVNVTRAFAITIAPSLVITPATLAAGTAGTAYAQNFSVAGGTQPYTFTIDSGSLPAGITLDPAGKLSGTPTGLGVFHFVVRVTDARQLTVTTAYDLTIAAPPVPTPTIVGVGDTAPPAQQPALTLQLDHAYPLPLDGTITLTFASAVGNIDDPAIQFSTGGRTAHFTVPPGATSAVFPASIFALATGTVAGKITLALTFQAGGQDVTPKPAPIRAIDIPAQAPVVTKLAASHTATGMEVVVTGFSNSRDMATATFQFQAAAGTNLTTSQVSIPVDQLFATWFNDPSSVQFGSQFTFTQPFTISGNTAGITGVTVTLTNKEGTSTAVSTTP
jgi:hypothetical protein